MARSEAIEYPGNERDGSGYKMKYGYLVATIWMATQGAIFIFFIRRYTEIIKRNTINRNNDRYISGNLMTFRQKSIFGGGVDQFTSPVDEKDRAVFSKIGRECRKEISKYSLLLIFICFAVSLIVS